MFSPPLFPDDNLTTPYVRLSIPYVGLSSSFQPKETTGHIDIHFSLKDHTLIFEVEDDGVGRVKAREIETLNNPEHKSMATSLTRERLVSLNKKLHKKINLEISDLKNVLGETCGTKVTSSPILS